MKNIKILFTLSILTLGFTSFALFGIGEDKKDTEISQEAVKEKTAEECETPSWAIAIGHEQKWKLHNGCPLQELDKENTNTVY